MNSRYTKCLSRIFSALIVLLLLASAVGAQTFTKELAPGVVLTQIVKQPSGPDDKTTTPRVINVLKIDPKARGLHIRTVLGGGDIVWGDDPTKGRETIGSIAKRLNAVAAINGDFCNWIGDPLGLQVMQGELVSEPYSFKRTVFGMTSDGKSLFDRLELDAKITLPDGNSFPIRGINRPREWDEAVIYTSRFFKSTCTDNGGSEAVITIKDLPVRLGVPVKGVVSKVRGDLGNTPIPADGVVISGQGTGSRFVENDLEEGMAVTIEFNLKPQTTTGWEKVVEAIGGTPRLIRGGKVVQEYEQENLKPGFFDTTHPRTAIGVTADGKLVFATVDGRRTTATGMPLKDLANMMLSQGCVEAMNMDGGGSTTMATFFGLLNCPSDTPMRALPNGVAVLLDGWPTAGDGPQFTISPPPGPVASGTTAQLALLDSLGKPLGPVLLKKAIWSTNGGIGFVDQSGKLYAIKAMKGDVTVKLGSRIVSMPIETVPGPASRLSAWLAADPTGAPNRSTLTVSVTDLNGNAAGPKAVSIRVEGGTSDEAALTTGTDGKASTGITWDAAPGSPAKVTASAPGLPPITLERPK